MKIERQDRTAQVPGTEWYMNQSRYKFGPFATPWHNLSPSYLGIRITTWLACQKMMQFHRCYRVKHISGPLPYLSQVRFKIGPFYTPWRGIYVYLFLAQAENNCFRQANRYGDWQNAVFEFDPTPYVFPAQP